MHTDPDSRLLRLFQLVSPSLPVGAFSYSQGLESAVDCKWVHDESTTKEWLHGLLKNSLCKLESPVLSRLHDHWHDDNLESVRYWNQYLLASRETREFREEDCHLGKALKKLLFGLYPTWRDNWDTQDISFCMAFSFAAVKWDVSKRSMIYGYLWAWLENQVLAAVKLVPLGQLAGQRVLLSVADEIPEIAEFSLAIDDRQIGASLPMVSLSSCCHETQYSRLFRS